jgi:hypothetical protein
MGCAQTAAGTFSDLLAATCSRIDFSLYALLKLRSKNESEGSDNIKREVTSTHIHSGFIGVAALDDLPWVSCVASISAIMSISTQAPNGTCATLTALREWMPRSPNTWTRSSGAPSAIR